MGDFRDLHKGDKVRLRRRNSSQDITVSSVEDGGSVVFADCGNRASYHWSTWEVEEVLERAPQRPKVGNYYEGGAISRLIWEIDDIIYNADTESYFVCRGFNWHRMVRGLVEDRPGLIANEYIYKVVVLNSAARS